MDSFAKLALLACLGLAVIAVPGPAFADDISARLDSLEKENAALRLRLNRIEASRTSRPIYRAPMVKEGVNFGLSD